MDENKLIQQFKDMQYVHASKDLHEKMQQQVYGLPDKHNGFYLPLFAFQMALVGLVLIVLVGLGSGVVLAAKGSYPGNPFYPIRKIIQKVAPQIFQDIPTPTPTKIPEIITPTPSVMPSSTIHQHHSIQGVGGENENENEKENKREIAPTINDKEINHTSQINNEGSGNEDHKGILQQLLDN